MWGKINKFVHSQAVIAVVLVSILFISQVTVIGMLVLDMAPSPRLMVFTMRQLILAGVALWVMRNLEVFDINDFSFKGVGIRCLLPCPF